VGVFFQLGSDPRLASKKLFDPLLSFRLRGYRSEQIVLHRLPSAVGERHDHRECVDEFPLSNAGRRSKLVADRDKLSVNMCVTRERLDD
jgi:hypothetical protein